MTTMQCDAFHAWTLDSFFGDPTDQKDLPIRLGTWNRGYEYGVYRWH